MCVGTLGYIYVAESVTLRGKLELGYLFERNPNANIARLPSGRSSRGSQFSFYKKAATFTPDKKLSKFAPTTVDAGEDERDDGRRTFSSEAQEPSDEKEAPLFGDSSEPPTSPVTEKNSQMVAQNLFVQRVEISRGAPARRRKYPSL